ncbi:MAG: HlyD family secretion protein, partial [Pseudomonadota bacterium]
FLYRMFVGITIIFFIANHYFFVGVLMAIIYGFQILIMPVLNGLGYLMNSKELGGVRLRAICRCIALCAVIGLGLAVVPVPHRGVLQGVVWMPEQARMVAGSSGLVEDVPATDGVHLTQGDIVAVSSSDALSARIAGLKARIDELEARVGLALTDSPSQAYQVNQHLTHARRMLSVAEAQAAALVVRAPRAGRFVAVADGAVKGKYLRRGDVIGFVIDGDAPVIVRLAVSEFDADLVRAFQGKADVRFSDDLGAVYPAQVMRELPLAGNTLPSKAISTQGGGPFQLNPDPENPLRTVGRIVTFELVVPDGPVLSRVGTRAFVRINYGARPLLWQLYRPARQLILRHLWM